MPLHKDTGKKQHHQLSSKMNEWASLLHWRIGDINNCDPTDTSNATVSLQNWLRDFKVHTCSNPCVHIIALQDDLEIIEGELSLVAWDESTPSWQPLLQM